MAFALQKFFILCCFSRHALHPPLHSRDSRLFSFTSHSSASHPSSSSQPFRNHGFLGAGGLSPGAEESAGARAGVGPVVGSEPPGSPLRLCLKTVSSAVDDNTK